MSEDIKKKVEQPFQIINFNAAYEPPQYSWNTAKSYISWGADNNYPQYLLKLYNYKGSTRHTSIINRKVDLISGQGFDEVTDERLKEFVLLTDLAEETAKMSIDLELFNGYSFELIWAQDGQSIASIKHLPVSQVRQGITSDKVPFDYYWYCRDWGNTRKYKPEAIDKYDPLRPVGKQIYYYSTYNPDNILVDYPIPYYSTCLNSIETDYEISRFHLNQARQGYAPSFILNFATGIPSDEEKDTFYRAFVKNYSGTENAGKAIITYSEGKDGEPLFEKVDLNDSDERFIMLGERIENDIVQGSGIPAPLVILTPGKLGGTEDRASLLAEFQKSYVSPRQNKLENGLNKVLANNKYSQKLTLKKYTE